MSAMPPSMLELARTTTWDESTSAALERFMAAMFDANSDGRLDDHERIVAVRALRDAVWPEVSNEAIERIQSPDDEASGLAAATTLSTQDRRLHHDVDEARRRDRQEGGGTGEIDADLRAEIVRRFQTDDDGRLTVDEFARYMAHRNAGSAAADLNSDGQIDDTDLRVFLDIASPID